MLVAALDDRRVEARDAARNGAFRCPRCGRAVTLKRGRIRIAHFAHKPPTDCAWARGETLAHMEAKHLLQAAFAARGLRAEVEHVVSGLPNDRRADVMVWSPSGHPAAVELQHTKIGLDELEARAFAYAFADIAQIWVPFLTPQTMAQAVPRNGGPAGDLFVERYPARPFERWAQAMQFGTLWFYDPTQKTFLRGRFDRHELWSEGGRMYSPDGEEVHYGGYTYFSKKWRELTLWGPYPPERIRLKTGWRPAWFTDRYRLPACRIVEFVVDGADVPD